ncbi:MAG: acyl-CoA dehydrogenase [SAR202 cluster bacterium]|jgi:glutaryl-CoA dehydrogenase|nr:acyl-CoA dehydrogenase family protein [SAR202 cluster bacterium]HAL46577.1 acyl-CoA dehydrogenase [Dehalococcoidia bacterium]MDP6665676.1 acyl-CoA dehydrogenase family protein [SAR202 cluster bacterium]MDP6799954.1 acyl-CoA dehydrogenase family protein [SAR202 cluster bacterium]MQG57119.1 acyl-CoA dehydrogenase [SAR202 cluster bacterium]|tara:strand:+ start:1394 stop:2551 length:1158 start_codon:yes stop_codon:yes gene_type:complete
MLDYMDVQGLLSDEERQVQSGARDFLEAEVQPDISDWWERGEFPRQLVPRLGEMGYLGANLPREYGAAGVDNVAYGLLMYELERIDSGLRSFASVQGALVMYPIHSYGSEEQKRAYLPEMAAGRSIGCFGLTEHEGGSDPGAMRTNARKDGESYVLNGTKMWITNGNIADVALVWAKDDEGDVRGFLVPTDTPGFTANEIKHKMSMRASVTSELVMEDCRVAASQMLPNVRGLRGPLSCLTQARYGIAWGALGALEAVYTDALDFSKTRSTFGRPIAGRQLVQTKLVDMLADHTKGLLLAWRLAVLKDQGKLAFSHVSLAKRENVRAALKAARTAREILGGSGIVLEHNAIRHMLNLETVDTYEGTHDIHTLILGRDITGENALE